MKQWMDTISWKTQRPIKRFLKSVFKNHVYVAKHGLAEGFKVTGDLGFLRNSGLTHEDRFYMSLDLTGKTIYDVGAHIGILTLFFFPKAAGETGQVISFEPNPETFAILSKNVAMNGLANVKLVNLGLGAKEDTLSLLYGEYDGGIGTLDEAMQAKWRQSRLGLKVKTVPVKIHPLDEYILAESLPEPDFVKIDVEGYEHNVLLGMQGTIRRCKPLLLVEIHGIGQKGKRENLCNVLELLFSHEYEIQEINSGEVLSEDSVEFVLKPPYTLVCK